MKYRVFNTATEQQSEHGTWQAAFRAAQRLVAADEDAPVVVIETDRDGQRTYNLAGEVIDRQF